MENTIESLLGAGPYGQYRPSPEEAIRAMPGEQAWQLFAHEPGVLRNRREREALAAMQTLRCGSDLNQPASQEPAHFNPILLLTE